MTRNPNQRSKTKNQKFSEWVNQGLKKARWPASRVAQLGLLICIAGAVAVLYLVQSSQIGTATRHLNDLRDDLARLQKNNANLVLEISVDGSTERVRQRAEAMGFAPEDKVIFLPVQTLPVDDAPTIEDALRVANAPK